MTVVISTNLTRKPINYPLNITSTLSSPQHCKTDNLQIDSTDTCYSLAKNCHIFVFSQFRNQKNPNYMCRHSILIHVCTHYISYLPPLLLVLDLHSTKILSVDYNYIYIHILNTRVTSDVFITALKREVDTCKRDTLNTC